jgi:hypothetical protein
MGVRLSICVIYWLLVNLKGLWRKAREAEGVKKLKSGFKLLFFMVRFKEMCYLNI